MKIFDAQSLAGGAYAQKQLFCKDRIVTWSHTSRFRLARKLVTPYAGSKLLDYSCGDGTFLALVHDLFPCAAGMDIDPQQTDECRQRFMMYSGLTFLLTDALNNGGHDHAYDVLTCMEVLEHCLDDELTVVITRLRRLVSNSGTVIISVPIEVGPSLIGKQIVRTIAGWRRLGGYQYTEKYAFHEFWAMVFAGTRTSIKRPVYREKLSDGRLNAFHGHKGFNWKSLRCRVSESFDIQRTCFSPLPWSRGLLCSQAWLICQPWC